MSLNQQLNKDSEWLQSCHYMLHKSCTLLKDHYCRILH